MKTKRWKKLYGHTTSFVCPYCLKTVPMAEGTIDHKNPFARSHDDSPKNKVLCCKKDNNKKGMLTEDEYMLYLLLDRVRQGGKDARDLEALDQHKQELSCIVNRKNQNNR